MANEYKPKSDIPDLYNILGLTAEVCKDPNCNDLIQKAYVRKAKLCHPDKHPGRKDIEEVFELLTSAYDILKDEKQRNAYNHKLTLNKQSSSDFLKLKDGTNSYMKTIGEYKPPTDQQKLSFKEQMKVLDDKHKFNSADATAISKNDAKKKLIQMEKERVLQDRDLKPEKLFDDGRFDLKKFNAAFDKVHKRDETAMMPHNGVPSAWNDMGTVANYSNFDNLDNLYVEDSNRFDTAKQNYSGIDFGPVNKITKDEIEGLNGADYVDGHNVLGDDYYKNMKERLRARKEDASSFETMKYGDFKRDDTAGYGIFDQLGFKIDDRLTFDVDDDDISKKFEKLMAQRQQDLVQINNGNQQSQPVNQLPPPIQTRKSASGR
jgi:curved DNA-binding protein CbpA